MEAINGVINSICSIPMLEWIKQSLQDPTLEVPPGNTLTLDPLAVQHPKTDYTFNHVQNLFNHNVSN